MKVVLEPDLAKVAAFRKLVEDFNPILESEIGTATDRVTATWGAGIDDRGRPLIRLSVSDWTGQTQREFPVEDLTPPEQARRRFNRLWSDQLQSALHRQFEKLDAIAAEFKG